LATIYSFLNVIKSVTKTNLLIFSNSLCFLSWLIWNARQRTQPRVQKTLILNQGSWNLRGIVPWGDVSPREVQGEKIFFFVALVKKIDFVKSLKLFRVPFHSICVYFIALLLIFKKGQMFPLQVQIIMIEENYCFANFNWQICWLNSRLFCIGWFGKSLCYKYTDFAQD
jgi:hypothetical protein